jgi:hypothetical protein
MTREMSHAKAQRRKAKSENINAHPLFFPFLSMRLGAFA